MNESNLHNYQKTSLTHIMENPFAGLFQEMGLGKTITTLTAINRLIFEELDITSALVIAPKRVVDIVWTTEQQKWDHLSHLKIVKVIGTEKQRRVALAEKADIYLIGRDNIAWLCGQYGGMMLPFDMLVIDESSSFKNPKSLRFKALRKVQPCFRRVLALTGTPAPNGLINLWSQIYLLDRGERLGKTITQYRESYFRPGKRNGTVVFDYELLKDSESKIHSKISDICISMKAEDYLDMPKRIDNYIEIEFPAALRKQYTDFEREQVLELLDSEQEISAANATVLSNKLLQFANGAIYDDDKNWHAVHDMKLDALEEILESAQGKPVLLAWTFRHDMYRIMERFKAYKPREMKTDKDFQDWNAGKIPLMLMHPASGGHGLNLQDGSNIAVWYGQTWDLELYQQFNGRLDRQGQKERVVLNHLVVKGSIDEDVIKSLASKDKKQEGLMQAVKARILKYSR